MSENIYVPLFAVSILPQSECPNFTCYCLLSDDPVKVEINFFCYAATVFPHIEMFSFLHRECINLQEDRLHDKMHLHSIFKECFYVLKDFDQSQELKTIAKKTFTILHVPHIGVLCYSN